MGMKFSPLAAIHRGNVAQLRVAWTFRVGDMYDPKGKGGRRSSLQTTPLFVGGTLYASTPSGRVVALDPEKGTDRWSFDPKSDVQAGWGDFANRGVASWVDRATGRRRIFVATIDARLCAVDAATGAVKWEVHLARVS